MTSDEFKEMRKTLGVSQAQLGKIVDRHSMTISRIERGSLKPFDLREKLENIMINGMAAYSLLRKLPKNTLNEVINERNNNT